MSYRVEIEGLEVTPADFGMHVTFKDRFEWFGVIVGLNGQFVTVRPWLMTGPEQDETADPRDLRWT